MQQDLNLFETRLDETAKAHLLETTRWTKFLAICAIIFLTLLLLYFVWIGIVFGEILGANQGSGGALGLMLVVFGLVGTGINIYPLYALLKFSSCMKKGIQSNNQELINEGFRYQKTMYRYLGILTIVYIVLTLLSVVFSGISSML